MIKAVTKLSIKSDMRKKLAAALKRAEGSAVTVGVHQDAGSYSVKGGQTVRYPAQVALWNEFGTKKMPARPFLGPAIDTNEGIIAKTQAECLQALVFANWSVEKALSKLGLFVQILIQNKIRANPLPGLSSAYAAEKRRLGQRERTLIATGLLLRSVRYKVQLGHAAKAEAEQAPHEAEATSHVSRSEGRAKAREDGKHDKLRKQQQRLEHQDAFRAFKAKKREEMRRASAGSAGASRASAKPPTVRKR